MPDARGSSVVQPNEHVGNPICRCNHFTIWSFAGSETMISDLMADVLWILQGHFEGGHESGALSDSSSDDAPLSLWQQDMSRWAPVAEVFVQQQGRSGEAAINVQKLEEITSIHRHIDRVRGTCI